MLRLLLLINWFLFNFYSSNAQNQDTIATSQPAKLDSNQLKKDSLEKKETIHPKRLKTLIIGGSATYVVAMTGLSIAWYGKGEKSKFHFFDDNAEWKQVDKVGHFYTAFNIARGSAQAFRWTGMSKKKAYFWGMMTGIMTMAPIELLDGFSAEYGASWGDLLANTTGAIFLYSQYALWDEMRIQPKFSFHQTGFAPQRPNLLGSNLAEQILKDYNGQTYWLSFDMDKFFKKSKFPKWLNIAVGYGASDFLYAQDFENQAVGLEPYRKYYLGIDFDLTAIRTKSKLVKALIYLVDNIRFPAPTFEFNRKDGVKFHFLYF